MNGPLTTCLIPVVAIDGMCFDATDISGVIRSRSGLRSCDPKSQGVSFGDHGRRLLVRAEEHAAALLADVDLAAEVDGHRQLVAGRLVERLDLGHVRGQHVLVLHGEDRELEADHPADLARPQAAGVDDVLGVDRVAVLDLDVPGLVRTLRQPGHQRVQADLGAGHLGALDVGAGDAGRVDVALDRSYSAPTKYCGSITGKMSRASFGVIISSSIPR